MTATITNRLLLLLEWWRATWGRFAASRTGQVVYWLVPRLLRLLAWVGGAILVVGAITSYVIFHSMLNIKSPKARGHVVGVRF